MEIEKEIEICGTTLSHSMQQQRKTVDYNVADPKVFQDVFCLMSWWRMVGSFKFKLLAPVAAIVYGKPSHNVFQERIFSLGTWKDSRLKKLQKEAKFEMEVLESVNVEFTMSDYYKTILQEATN